MIENHGSILLAALRRKDSHDSIAHRDLRRSKFMHHYETLIDIDRLYGAVYEHAAAATDFSSPKLSRMARNSSLHIGRELLKADVKVQQTKEFRFSLIERPPHEEE
jgi:hypothetical protein